jgi:hypothetical protein
MELSVRFNALEMMLQMLEYCTKFNFDWTALPLPLHSPDLAPSDFRLLGPMKGGLCRQHFPDTIFAYVRKWVASTGVDFHVQHAGSCSWLLKMHSQ